MPTYEYHCAKCDHQFDLFQSIKDKPVEVCPKEKCPRKPWGKGKVQRIIGAGAGLIFKGSGFYITDYRSEKYKEAAKKEASAASPPSGDKPGGASKSESAPASSPKPSGESKKTPPASSGT